MLDEVLVVVVVVGHVFPQSEPIAIFAAPLIITILLSTAHVIA